MSVCPICGAEGCAGDIPPPRHILTMEVLDMAGPYIADRRLYLDEDGNVVEEGDPRKRTLLVHAGGMLPYERAQELGLTEEKAAAAPAENKQRTAAPENKALQDEGASPKKRGA